MVRERHASGKIYGFTRKVFLRIFSRLNPGDISIRHHFTNDRLTLHSFKHKGYWFHGRNREKETINLFSDLISPGDVVLDVGGHIGYMSLLFAKLATSSGKVIVFEPGTNNLPYIRKNIAEHQNIELQELAVSNERGTASFYVEDLTGQNNSLVKDYEIFQENVKSASVSGRVDEDVVETTTIDHFVDERNLAPSFVKIDIEGAEAMAIRGAINTIQKRRPILMVEVTKDYEQVFEMFQECGYRMFSSARAELSSPNDLRAHGFSNVFFLPKESVMIDEFFPASEKMSAV